MRQGSLIFPILIVLLSACGSGPPVAPGQWFYTWADPSTPGLEFLNDGSIQWTASKNVWNPPGRTEGAALWAKLELADHDVEAPSLLVEGFDQVAEAFAVRPGGAEQIYTFGATREDGSVIFSGNPYHIIDLHADDRLLYFRIFSDHSNIGVQGQPRIGNGSRLLENIVKEDFGRILMGLWTLLAAIFALVLFLRDGKEQLFLAFAGICFLSGLYVVTRGDVKQMLIDAPYWWVITEFTSLYLLPATVHYYFWKMMGPGLWNFRKILIPVQLLFAFTAIPASVAGFVPLVKTLPAGQILLLLALILTLGSTVRGALQGNQEARIVSVGWAFVMITVVHAVLVAAGIIGWSRFYVHFGILAFLLSLAVVLIRRVSMTGQMLERTSKYLSRVIREQDATVAFRTEALQRSRDEIEKISEVAKQINASTDLDQVLDQIFRYFYTEFGAEAVILQMVDKEKNELYTTKTTVPPNANPEMVKYSEQMTIPLDESSGIIYKTFLRKRPFYLAKVDHRAFPSGTEREIVDKLELKSFALLPLTIADDVVAMILMTSYNRKLKLSRDELKRIERFADQVGGAINHANLLRRAENSRKEADQERRKTEEVKVEIETLNKFSREVSSNPRLDDILDKIFYYVISQFNLMGCYLYLRDEKSDELYLYKSMLPDSVDQSNLDHVNTRRIPLESESILASVCRRKRALYLPRIRRKGGTQEDHAGIEALNVSSMFMVPLIVQDRARGLIAFSNFDSPMFLRPEDLKSIERFCLQIAGAVFTASLLRQVDEQRKRSDRLLLNVLPAAIAVELKDNGKVEPRPYEAASVMFTDIKNFTSVVANLDPHELILELDQIFEQFDLICEQNKIEKLKTIGDAYMCAGGLPFPNRTHAIDVCLAAMEIQAFMRQTGEIKKQITGEDFWELRVGIHTGPMVAGVVGKAKFAYDVWGDAVNVAARMETAGEAGRVNISRATYEEVKYFFQCEHRGQLKAKNRGMLDMYFVNGIRPELSRNNEGRVPNDRFRELYEKVASGARLRFRSEQEIV